MLFLGLGNELLFYSWSDNVSSFLMPRYWLLSCYVAYRCISVSRRVIFIINKVHGIGSELRLV